MGRHASPDGAIDLGVLDDYLMSDYAPDDSMGLSDLDGFLTGIAAGPELILPSEWLPIIWGGAEPKFGSEEEMRAVLAVIMARYNEIVVCLKSNPDELDPVFWEGLEGELIASDWAAGFLDAVALRSQAWEPLLEDTQARLLMAPLFVLSGDVEISDDAVSENELMTTAAQMIPDCVLGIQNFWHGLNLASN